LSDIIIAFIEFDRNYLYCLSKS